MTLTGSYMKTYSGSFINYDLFNQYLKIIKPDEAILIAEEISECFCINFESEEELKSILENHKIFESL